MKKKKPATALWFVLAAIVLILAAAGGYRWLSSLSLSEELQQDVRITSLEVWRPFAQIGNMPVSVKADEETKQQIVDLITAPRYYRTLIYNGFGGDTQFIIYLEGLNEAGKVKRYSYRISNLGEVAISNLDIGGEQSYLTDDHNPLIVSRQELRELYANIAQLTKTIG